MTTVEGQSEVLVLRCEYLTTKELRGLQAALEQIDVVERTFIGPATGVPEYRNFPVTAGLTAFSVIATFGKGFLEELGKRAAGDLYDELKKRDVFKVVQNYLISLPKRPGAFSPYVTIEQGIPKRLVIRADEDGKDAE